MFANDLTSKVSDHEVLKLRASTAPRSRMPFWVSVLRQLKKGCSKKPKRRLMPLQNCCNGAAGSGCHESRGPSNKAENERKVEPHDLVPNAERGRNVEPHHLGPKGDDIGLDVTKNKLSPRIAREPQGINAVGMRSGSKSRWPSTAGPRKP